MVGTGSSTSQKVINIKQNKKKKNEIITLTKQENEVASKVWESLCVTGMLSWIINSSGERDDWQEDSSSSCEKKTPNLSDKFRHIY